MKQDCILILMNFVSQEILECGKQLCLDKLLQAKKSGVRTIQFNNMLTNILKNKSKSKHRHEAAHKWETQRDKELILKLEEPNIENIDIFEEFTTKKVREQFLPPIYKTENLIPYTNKAKMSITEHSNPRPVHKLSIPKLKRLTLIKQTSPQKENVRMRALTDERQTHRQNGQSRIYHNFVNKKKNKKVNHMSKIIEKVISEDIEPWNLQNSKVLMQVGPNSKQCNRWAGRGKWGDYSWQKYVLSDMNMMLDRR